jgi:hypothetical protein
MAAARVPEECPNKDTFALWLTAYGIVPMAVGVLLQFFVVMMAICKAGAAFKLGLRLQLGTELISCGLIIWGWLVYADTDNDCDTSDDIKPRLLMYVFLIIGSIGLPCAVCGSLVKMCKGDVHQPKIEPGDAPEMDAEIEDVFPPASGWRPVACSGQAPQLRFDGKTIHVSGITMDGEPYNDAWYPDGTHNGKPQWKRRGNPADKIRYDGKQWTLFSPLQHEPVFVCDDVFDDKLRQAGNVN